MVLAFLIGLLAVIGVISVIYVAYLTAKWIKEKISFRLKNRSKHKIVFADTREVVDDFLKNKLDSTEEIPMDDLERMCEKTPYVMADYDEETHSITDFEGIKANEIESHITNLLKTNSGMLVVEE